MNSVKDQALGISLISSLLLHGLALVIAAAFVHHGSLRDQDFFSVRLVDIQSLRETVEIPAEKKSLALAESKRPNEIRRALKSQSSKPEPVAAPSSTKDESVKSVEAKSDLPGRVETPTALTTARVEGGGSEAGTSTLFGRSDAGLLPGSGSGGGGNAAAGLGRGSGAPGFPSQQTILRTNREAKPIQTARATYPAMALRAGLESDVILRIEVDPQGVVTQAEIIKSGGSGFDHEALKAVKQSRFEPAQRDGQTVPAEFTFVYRFRLQR